MLQVLESFHHKVARRITGKMARRINNTWVYPPLQEAMDKAGLLPLREYINRRHQTVADYVATQPILQHCVTADAASTASSLSLC